MSSFLLALQFLTTLPLKISGVTERKIAYSIIYFPLVGLVIGLALLGLNNFLSTFNFSALALNIILVVALVIITGGMHLDGLADTFDAILSHKSKDEMLAIMRDPRIGTMGALSLICVILLKIGLLNSVGPAFKAPALLSMCFLSRWSAALLMFSFPCARKDGLAGVFMRNISLRAIIICAGLTIILTFAVWSMPGIILSLLVSLCAYLIAKNIGRKVGGITGDTLGAVIEITEVVVLFCTLLIERTGSNI
jgi:adenosylcobinamide-GDP ribazoletransferase